MLPWLVEPFAQLRKARRGGRLPPALLIHEDPGSGGAQLAQFLACLVLCPEGAGGEDACGQCSSCQRVARSEHPDFHRVVPDPELKSGQISVDQIREISRVLTMSGYEGKGSCVAIAPAEAMTRAAANALLKTLEEPRRDAHLVLITTLPSRLPATVRSRCQKLRVQAPSRDEALAWLAQQRPAPRADWEAVLDVLGVAPLEALACDPAALRSLRDDTWSLLREASGGRLDIVRVADRWAKDQLPLRLRAIENCLTRCALGTTAGSAKSQELGSAAHLPAGHPDINIATALRLVDEVRELQLLQNTSIARPLALERHLWRLVGATMAG